MTIKPLQTHILRLITGILLVTTLAITLAVWISTSTHVQGQINNQLSIGRSVLERLLATREEQLLASAEVLTADFGFKQAIASGDSATLQSALVNHGERINADLMALVSLKNKIVASSSDALPANAIFPIDDILARTLRDGGASDFIQLGPDIYQVIVLPVRVPLPVGVTVIGFRLNDALASELKEMSGLDVTFVSKRKERIDARLTTLADADVLVALNGLNNSPSFRVPFSHQNNFVTEALTLSENQQITVYLSSSVDAAFASFDMLQIEILLITLFAVVIALIGGILFARKLVLPLQTLSSLAGKIAKGNYQSGVTVSGNVQEIGNLVDAFNRMEEDLSEREAHITYQADHDTLTELKSRSRAIARLNEIINPHVADQDIAMASIPAALHIIVVNIQDFRKVNDAFGHDIGDLCLQHVAKRLTDSCEGFQFAARLGGDEFLFIAPTNAEHINPTKLLELLHQPYIIDDLTITLDFSLGVAQFPNDAQDADELIKKASIALDLSLHEKDAVVFYNADVEQTHHKRLLLLADLKQTLQNNDGQLRMYYQPKVSVKDMDVERFEALIRWIHPIQGFIPPDSFIPLAEQAGLIQQVTEWVVATVIQQIGEWKTKGFVAKVAVNLSAQDLSSPKLLDLINDLLKEHNVRASSISFELTESELMREPEAAIALLNKFRQQGFELSIDDFGTGYSSLSQLKNMPVTELKIDRSFITELDTTPHDQIITKSTIELAHSFGLSIVAEGVETIEAYRLLEKWGIDWAQGYYFSRPLPADDVLPWASQFKKETKKISTDT